MTKQDYETLEALISQQLMQLEKLTKVLTEITDKLNVAESISRRDVIDYSAVVAVGFSIDTQIEVLKAALDVVHSCAPEGSDNE